MAPPLRSPSPLVVTVLAVSLAGCGGGGGGDSGNSNGGSTGSSGSAISNQTPAPTIALSADPTSVSWGEAFTLTWSSTNSTSCSGTGAWSGPKPTSGSETSAALSASATFTLTCMGPGGNDTRSVTISSTTKNSTVSFDAAIPPSVQSTITK